MSNRGDEIKNQGEAARYQIRVEGQLGTHWASRFDGMDISLDDGGDTRLTGQVVDQAALYGLLKVVRDSGMTLVSVKRVES